jgi:glycosyl transferase family 92
MFGICAILKDEPIDHIKEWLYFHTMVGVEHFWLYDNESAVPLKECLKHEIEAGIVDVINFPGKSPQMPAYTHFIYNYGKLVKYAAIIDADEFLFPKTGYNLSEILDLYDKPEIGALNVSWILFGSSGHIEKPKGLVIENYNLAMPRDHIENKHTKAILIRPGERAARAGTNPHYVVMKNGYVAVSETFEPVSGALTTHSSEKIVLHHYCLKSLENFKEKIAKPRADKYEFQRKTLDDFYRFDKDCIEKNEDIFRFIPALKAKLNAI